MPKMYAIRAALALLLCLPCAVSAQPAARLAISPDRYELAFEAGGGETQSLMVKNLAPNELTVQLSVANWDLDEHNRVREIAPREDSLDQWLVINPLRVTIPPQTPQTVRWAILPRQAPEPGEYRAIIFIEEVLEDKPANSAASVRMKLRYGIPIYAQFGEAVDKAEVLRIAPDETQRAITMDLRNSGNRHARFSGVYGVWPSSEFPGTEAALAALGRNSDNTAIKMHDVVLLPDNARSIRIEPPLPGPGDYVVQFDASFGDTALRDAVTLKGLD